MNHITLQTDVYAYVHDYGQASYHYKIIAHINQTHQDGLLADWDWSISVFRLDRKGNLTPIDLDREEWVATILQECQGEVDTLDKSDKGRQIHRIVGNSYQKIVHWAMG